MSKGNKYWRKQIGGKCFINNKKKQRFIILSINHKHVIALDIKDPNFLLGSYTLAKKYKIPKKLIIMEGSLEEKIYKLKE